MTDRSKIAICLGSVGVFLALCPIERTLRRRRRPIEGGKSNERSRLLIANRVVLLAHPQDVERQ